MGSVVEDIDAGMHGSEQTRLKWYGEGIQCSKKKTASRGGSGTKMCWMGGRNSSQQKAPNICIV